jgi:hypothetical protein
MFEGIATEIIMDGLDKTDDARTERFARWYVLHRRFRTGLKIYLLFAVPLSIVLLPFVVAGGLNFPDESTARTIQLATVVLIMPGGAFLLLGSYIYILHAKIESRRDAQEVRRFQQALEKLVLAETKQRKVRLGDDGEMIFIDERSIQENQDPGEPEH